MNRSVPDFAANCLGGERCEAKNSASAVLSSDKVPCNYFDYTELFLYKYALFAIKISVF